MDFSNDDVILLAGKDNEGGLTNSIVTVKFDISEKKRKKVDNLKLPEVLQKNAKKNIDYN